MNELMGEGRKRKKKSEKEKEKKKRDVVEIGKGERKGETPNQEQAQRSPTLPARPLWVNPGTVFVRWVADPCKVAPSITVF
jgi:hypothetical protein